MIDLAAPPFTLLAERDMDLLVLEEMLSSNPFRKWLVGKLYNGARQLHRLIGAWHTPSLEPLGSIDILFIFEEMSAHRRCAVLIENKIDQPKQNLQAQRYFEFGEKGVQDGYWDEYLTCLFSPQAYFSSLEPSEYFSSYLSYEEIEQWFSRAAAESHSATIERSAYKKTLIRRAIEQGTGMMRQQTQMMNAEYPAELPPVTRQTMLTNRQPQPSVAPMQTSVQMPASRQPQPSITPMQTPVPSAIQTPMASSAPMQMPMTSSSQLPRQMPQGQEEIREPVEAAEKLPSPVIAPQKKKSSASDFRVFPGGVFNLPAGYREEEDTISGNFFNDVLSYSTQYYPELGMKKPTGSAAEAAWVEFAPNEFPKDVRIIHKMPQGFMDLSFAMTSLATIQPPYQPYIDSDMTFKENGKTAIIRIMVPPVDPQEGFDSQRDTVGFAMKKAQKLYQLYIHVVNNGLTARGYAPEELYL